MPDCTLTTPLKSAKVLVLGDVTRKTDTWKQMSTQFSYYEYNLTSREEFIHKLQTTFSDINAIWITWEGFSPIGGLDDEIVAHLPSSLKMIVSCAVGYDHLNGAALAERGITLCNAPGLAAAPVADHVLLQTLSLFRYTPIFEHILRRHGSTNTTRTAISTSGWDSETGRPLQHLCNQRLPDYDAARDHAPRFSLGAYVGGREVRQPRGHSVGIVGFGAIGREIGARLASIGMKVHYYKRSPLTSEETAALGYEATYHSSLDSALQMSELLVLACPLTSDTLHMLNSRTFALLPDGAKLINIGRGKLIDTSALLDALRAGKVTGAALDVFESEPNVEPELLQRWDVLLTPHIASSTIETLQGAEQICVDNMVNGFYGDGLSVTRVN